ncbi:unnamed protein product [Cuscuta epithymum]|uniref:Glutathione S-transferase n=1 Tax=Cuscuta epithymum TaxID=186058 RepID=A0AAV0GIH2_9ASTE|nr:unnamed protein product [Cuscuta epithymum]CAH9147661.1 unnamed protein product [Cuscuta epithymum]
MATDEDKVVLLCTTVSMFAMRVKMALSLKHVHYQSKIEDLRNKSSLLLEMNPVHKKIPVLIHNGKPICESLIILEYVDEVWSEKSPLLPSDPYRRAQARFWADFIDKKIYESLKAWLFKTKDEKAIKEELVDSLKVLEGELGDEPYFGGRESIGFLDLVLVSYYTWLLAFENDLKLNMESECPKMLEWGKRCLQNKAISNNLADPLEIYEFVLKMRNMSGLA